MNHTGTGSNGARRRKGKIEKTEQEKGADEMLDSELNEELHELVLSAKAAVWQLRRNSTEYYCVTWQFS